MRAYTIAMFLIIFNMSIILVGALSIFPTFGGAGELNPLANPADEMLNISDWDWKSLVLTGTGLIFLIGSVIFRLPVGAAVFAVTFAFTAGFSSTMLNALTQEPYGLMPEIVDLVLVSMAFVFLFAFIQLASASTGD